MPTFEAAFTLEKAYIKKETGKRHVVGSCSDNTIDRQSERVSDTCLEAWVVQCKKGIDLLDTHRSTFAFGRTADAQVVCGPDNLKTLVIDIELDDRFAESHVLFEDVEKGACTKQMSIGGMINMENPNCVSYEMQKDGGLVRVLNDVELDHVATTRHKQAANDNTGFSHAIIKTMEEAGFQFKTAEAVLKDCKVPLDIQREVDDEIAKEFADILVKEEVAKSPFDFEEVQTNADISDGHRHWIRVDENGNGQTSASGSPYHSHVVRNFKVVDVILTPEYTSSHGGKIPATAAKSQLDDRSSLQPFSGPDDSRVPDYVKSRGERTRKAWVTAWNSAFEKYRRKGGNASDCESTAFAVANSVLRRVKESEMTTKTTTATAGSPTDGLFQKIGDALTHSGIQKSEAEGTTTAVLDAPLVAEVQAGEEVKAAESAPAATTEPTAEVKAEAEKAAADKAPSPEDILAALATLNKAAEKGLPDAVKEAVRGTLEQLNKSLGSSLADDFLSAAEFGEALKSIQGLPGVLKAWAEDVLLKSLTMTIEKVGAQTGALEKAVKSINDRVVVIEEIEGGSASLAEGLSDGKVQKSADPDDCFTGLFNGSIAQATRKL